MKLRKITALLTSAFIAVTAFSATSFADEPTYDPIVFGDVEITSANENIFDSGLVVNINPAGSIGSPIAQPNGTFECEDYILHTDDLTSTDAVDFYTFTISGTRSVIFRLDTTNEDYVAILCPYDQTTGDITVSGPYVTGGGARAVLGFNSNSQNTYCAVILNQGSTYGTTYTFAMNAISAGTATNFTYADPDLRRAVFQYGNTYKMNNSNIKTLVDNYISQNIPEIDTDVVYEEIYFPQSSASAYHKCTVKVSTSQAFLGNMEYGRYVTSKAVYHHTIKIPLNGGSYHCSRQVAGSNSIWDGGTADGYLVYDLEQNKLVDWASTNNFFHTSLYNISYDFTSYATL